MNLRETFQLALANVANYGDTDVFPFPVENRMFRDKPDESLALLEEIHKDFDAALKRSPILEEGSLAAVGYTGFRWATQIDPLWNAYLLGLVISIGEDIEKARIPVAKDVVFSYRFRPDLERSSLFERDVGWRQFQKHSLARSAERELVLTCDISDFYSRIYHHRVENELLRAVRAKETVHRIMTLLTRLSQGVSYGLPVGGPAARLISELLLNSNDHLLLTEGVDFCRFADDYHIFADTKEEAYGSLIFLSEKLLKNEGLALQKSKTRLMTSHEFQTTAEALSEEAGENGGGEAAEAEARSFMSIKIHFDPYSETADEDYEVLKEELLHHDIEGMLNRELGKSRIHQPLMKQLIASIGHLEPELRDSAVLSLLENLQGPLYPVFNNVMILIKAVIDDLGDKSRAETFATLRQLIRERSFILRPPVNLAFAVRVLAYDPSAKTDQVLNRLYKENGNMILRRDVILAMAKRSSTFWITDLTKRYATLTPWEARALLVASYTLGEAGRYFRRTIKTELTPFDRLATAWCSARKKSASWEIPL